MKILILPDIHGRDFWVEPCSYPENYDKIIFLGDYHDPYSFQVSQDKSRHQLRDLLVPYVKKYRDKVICLYGNHDNYIINGDCCRHDNYHYEEIKNYLNKLDLQLMYKIDNYLFTHSGVTVDWLNQRKIQFDDLFNFKLDDYRLNEDVSSYRGGGSCGYFSRHQYGSPIWGDVREYYDAKKLPELYQIFGHTQMEKEIITNEFACLDCRKAFVLDTETKELKQYEYELREINEN